MPIRSVSLAMLLVFVLGGVSVVLWASRMREPAAGSATDHVWLQDLPEENRQYHDVDHQCDTGWPQLFGPTHDSISPEHNLITNWSANGPPRHWKMSIGTGYSTSVLWGERLILLHRAGDQEIVQCLAAESGAGLWKFSYPTSYTCKFGYSSGPFSTPIISGSRVYALGAQGQFHCLDLETGELIWKRQLSRECQIPENLLAWGTHRCWTATG